MRYDVYIDSIDGERHFRITTTVAKEALDYLKKYDHEGSSITVRVESTNSEEAYNLLSNEDEV